MASCVFSHWSQNSCSARVFRCLVDHAGSSPVSISGENSSTQPDMEKSKAAMRMQETIRRYTLRLEALHLAGNVKPISSSLTTLRSHEGTTKCLKIPP